MWWVVCWRVGRGGKALRGSTSRDHSVGTLGLNTTLSVHTLVRCFPREPALQVLDAIDAGSSALIVAPTSSGKTFISSYCINSVVARPEDPEGIVVFVAPNKALVNQVAAQVRPPPCGALCRCEAVPAVRATMQRCERLRCCGTRADIAECFPSIPAGRYCLHMAATCCPHSCLPACNADAQEFRRCPDRYFHSRLQVGAPSSPSLQPARLCPSPSCLLPAGPCHSLPVHV